MAIFRLENASLGRRVGRSATNAAAYRAGERIRDERTGRVFNHSDRTDVLHKEIVLSDRFDGREPDWTQDRSLLWNAAERAETRKNSRVAREYQIALPAELTSDQRRDLIRGFAREVANRYSVAVDLTIHAPRPGSDQRNYHAHLLSTTREVMDHGLGAKSVAEISDAKRLQQGRLRSADEYRYVRQLWASMANEAMRSAGLEARIDHRSLEAQGINREPGPLFPLAAVHTEKRGLRSEVAERIRERYRDRVAAREARTAQQARPSIEEIRKEAVAAWLKYRETARAAAARPGKEHSLDASMEAPEVPSKDAPDLGYDLDFGL